MNGSHFIQEVDIFPMAENDFYKVQFKQKALAN